MTRSSSATTSYRRFYSVSLSFCNFSKNWS